MLKSLAALDYRRPIQRTHAIEVATAPPVEVLPVPVVTVEKPTNNKMMGEVTRFTRADVATRNGKGGAAVWIIVRDQVYDCTNYMHEHPGGDASILEEAGKDATKAFDNSGHTADAHTIMAKYKIGEIVEEEKHYDANGKKKKRVVSAPPEDGGGRSCISIVCCGLLG